MSIVQISSTICHALVSLYESIAVHPRACAIIGAAGLVGIDPESIRSTGAWCPGSFCATH